MFGWISLATAFASRWKRATKAGSLERCSARTLIATSRSSSESRAPVDVGHAPGGDQLDEFGSVRRRCAAEGRGRPAAAKSPSRDRSYERSPKDCRTPGCFSESESRHKGVPNLHFLGQNAGAWAAHTWVLRVGRGHAGSMVVPGLTILSRNEGGTDVGRYDGSTALLVVDIQNDFADPNGSLYVKGGEDVVAVANDEIDAALAAGALVVYTQDWHPDATPHFKKDGGIWPVHCVKGTWGAEFHPNLHVKGDIVQKGTGGEDGYSGFTVREPTSGATHPTVMESLLRKNDIERVVVAAWLPITASGRPRSMHCARDSTPWSWPTPRAPLNWIPATANELSKT